MEFVQAKMQQIDTIQQFYNNLIDSDESYSSILRWQKNVYPAYNDFKYYIERGELYILIENDMIIASTVVTTHQLPSYSKINWQKETDDVGVIHLLAIGKNYQGRGLARYMLDCIVSLCKELHIVSLRLDAIESNIPAQRLYEKYGFVYCGKEKEFYESTGLVEFLFYEYLIS